MSFWKHGGENQRNILRDPSHINNATVQSDMKPEYCVCYERNFGGIKERRYLMRLQQDQRFS